MTEKNYADQLKEIFDTKFELGFEPPVVFIDTHYNKSNPEELAAFERETEKLWKTSVNRKPFECLTRYFWFSDICAKLHLSEATFAFTTFARCGFNLSGASPACHERPTVAHDRQD